jgi:hypothetical protein
MAGISEDVDSFMPLIAQRCVISDWKKEGTQAARQPITLEDGAASDRSGHSRVVHSPFRDEDRFAVIASRGSGLYCVQDCAVLDIHTLPVHKRHRSAPPIGQRPCPPRNLDRDPSILRPKHHMASFLLRMNGASIFPHECLPVRKPVKRTLEQAVRSFSERHDQPQKRLDPSHSRTSFEADRLPRGAACQAARAPLFQA